MKKIVLIFLIFVAFANANELNEFIANQHEVNRNGMLTLGSWGATNLIVGVAGRSYSTGEAKYFHEMNAAWGLINLGIASFGYIGSLSPDLNLQLGDALKEQRNIENFLLFNAGLDIGYMAAGLYLKEKSLSSSNPNRLKGYGNALLLQGAFLMLFDLTMYYFQSDLSGSFLENIESLQLGFGSIKIKF